MTYIFVFLSIFSMVLQNSLQNSASKKFIKTTSDTYYFNVFTGIVCAALSGLLLLSGESISLFSIVSGAVYGVALLLCVVAKMSAFACGPLHLTVLICASSMIVPSISGAVFFGEPFSLMKLVAVFLLMAFIFISLDIKKDGAKHITKKWVILSFLSFWLQGSLGIIQKFHQSSVYKDEIAGFLLASFVISFVFSAVMSSMAKNRTPRKPVMTFCIFGILCGMTLFCMSYVNIILSGILPAQIMFPVVNGSELLLTTVVSIVLFKEKTSFKQIIGLAGGLATLILICFI